MLIRRALTSSLPYSFPFSAVIEPSVDDQTYPCLQLEPSTSRLSSIVASSLSTMSSEETARQERYAAFHGCVIDA